MVALVPGLLCLRGVIKFGLGLINSPISNFIHIDNKFPFVAGRHPLIQSIHQNFDVVADIDQLCGGKKVKGGGSETAVREGQWVYGWMLSVSKIA